MRLSVASCAAAGKLVNERTPGITSEVTVTSKGCGVSARGGGVWGGIADLGEPIGISLGFRVAVRSGGADRGHRSPEIVGVFSIVECAPPVGETQIEERKQPSILRSRQVMRQRRGLGDLVPVVLNGSVPKATGQCLIRSSGRAAGNTQRFDLVESIAVPVAGQRWWAPWTKLVRTIEGKGGNARPMRELGLLRKIRRSRLVIS